MSRPVSVSVDRGANRVTLEGALEWREIRDGLFLAREVTRYTVELPFRGSPFDPAFRTPGGVDDATVQMPGRVTVRIGDPKMTAETDVATGLNWGLHRNTQPGPGGWEGELVIQSFTRAYRAGALDGDQTYSFYFRMNADFNRVTEAAVLYEVRMPVAGGGSFFTGSDGFTEEIYLGAHAFGRPVVAAAASPAPVPEGVTLRGAAGTDTLQGGAGDDLLFGRGGADRLVGRAGDDRLYGGAGPDVLIGGAGADQLFGGPGGDRLFGGPGRDVLNGGGGADVLDGGPGDDVLTGGPGADVFVFGRNSGRDVITDFGRGDNRIDLSGRPDVSRWRDIRDDIVQRGDDAVVRLGDDRIVLRDIDVGDLGWRDFIF